MSVTNKQDSTEFVDGIEILFRKSPAISESKYPGFKPGSYVLKKGSQQRSGGMPLESDIMVEQDVPVPLRDGVTIRVDIYRPVGDEVCPSIMGWSPYGKRGSFLNNDDFGHPTRMDVPVAWEDGLNKFEAPNPAYWVAHGYAVIAPDSRGTFMSEGDVRTWGEQEPMDEYDLIEWVAEQPWSNGKVGLTGNSMLAMSQWFVAAMRPPHLTAIAPWEGASDIYRDVFARGGIPETIFTEGIFSHIYGNNRTEDPVAMIKKYPRYNAYWESKRADLEQIEVPAYIVASWTNILHTNGTCAGWRDISSKEKWLRVNNTHEWTDYYDPANVEDLRCFFDHYLKGLDNGWEATPPVRLAVLDPGNTDTLNRGEKDFPLSRQKFIAYYLGATGQLDTNISSEAAEFSYDSSGVEGVSFRMTFDKETELTGYMKLKLWVEARGNDDMDLFAFVRKIDAAGNIQMPTVVTDRTHVGPNGRLRVSLRATDPARSTTSEPFMTFDHEEKLRQGEIVPVEIGFWPYSIRWQAGESLELLIIGADLLVRPEFPQFPRIPTINHGRHVVHVGGSYDSHLLVPSIRTS